jgi:hypothetical protein
VKPILSIFYVGLFLCAVAQAEVTIPEVGLSGYVARGPNRVLVEITNPSSSPQEFTLRLMWRRSLSDDVPYTDHKLRLDAGESRKLDLALYYANGEKLVAQQIDPAGQVVSSAEKAATSSNGDVVAVVCSSTPVCTATAQAIRASNTIEERNAREQRLKIILLPEPPQNWFAYNPANSVVVAGPISSPASRAAIADYARLGGKVIVALDQAPRDLLAEYRLPGRDEVAVGRGVVTFLNHATGAEMEDAFRAKTPASEPRGPLPPLTFSTELNSNWLLSRVGTHFEFPRLWWLIGWMAAYTIVIGLVNFMLLRRMGKVELAWITVPALALVFGVTFYLFSAHGKMGRFALDEISVCWMDDKSARGALNHNVRVISPQVRDVTLQTPAGSALASVDNDPLFRASEVSDVWSEHKPSRSERAPDVTVDSAQHIQMEMLRLSFRDFEFESMHEFPGTVRLDQGRLKNSTGQSFRQAVLVDFEKQQFYELGALPEGSEIDPFAKSAQRMLCTTAFYSSKFGSPLSLAETMRLWAFHTALPRPYLVFYGLTDQPLLGAQLEGIASQRKTYTLFTVKVGRPQ